MIMNIKQRKIQIEPKTKLNYNIYMLWGFSVLGQNCPKLTLLKSTFIIHKILIVLKLKGGCQVNFKKKIQPFELL